MAPRAQELEEAVHERLGVHAVAVPAHDRLDLGVQGAGCGRRGDPAELHFFASGHALLGMG